MTRKIPGFVFVLATALAVATASLYSQQAIQGKGGDWATGPYDVVEGWPDNPCSEGYTFGSTGGIFAESPDRVFIFQRGCLPELPPDDDSVGERTSLVPSRNASGYSWSAKDPKRHPRREAIVYIVNREGTVIDTWDEHKDLFVRPHKVKISPYDPERHVWIVEDGGHQVHKFTNDGKLVMSIGEFAVPGNDESHFDRPTDIAWLPDGTFFVSDGYNNTRVVKFDAKGKFLMAWGERGNDGTETRPGYMNTVHSIAVGSDRRVYVADRANARIQVFDENGKFIDAWPNVRRPYYIYMAANNHLWVADGTTQKFTKFNLKGDLLYAWGTFGAFPGGHWGPHQISVDSAGNLYTADVHVGRPQKFTPKKGANRDHLIGMEIGWVDQSSGRLNRLGPLGERGSG